MSFFFFKKKKKEGQKKTQLFETFLHRSPVERATGKIDIRTA